MISIRHLRTLTLEDPSQPGRPAHVSAASGLVRKGGSLFVVADDENHLGIFPDAGEGLGNLVPIAAGELPLKKGPRKRRKPDFESLALLPAFPGHSHGALVALGSCSRANRCGGVVVGLDSSGAPVGPRTLLDLSGLRNALDSRFGCLNLEGCVVIGDELVLLHRGNKGDQRNARIRLRLDRVMAAISGDLEAGSRVLVDIHEHDLGRIGDVPFGFSDASALPDGRMVFTAVAEDTDDSYEDGGCVGSGVGVIDRAGRVVAFERLEGDPKVEGVEAWLEDGRIGVLLVTDADDVDVPATLFQSKLT